MSRLANNSLIKLCLFALSGLCITCDYPLWPESSGKLTAKVNGVSWENTYDRSYHTLKLFTDNPVSDSCAKDDRYILDNMLYDERTVRQEELMFTNIVPMAGRYSLTSENLNHCDTTRRIQCLLNSQMDLDLGGDSFRVLESEENYFDIEYFNIETGEIKGQFKCTLVLSPPRRFNKAFPDTLRFTDGKFYAKLVPPFLPKGY